MTIKTCTGCHTDKPATAFYVKDPKTGKRQSWCRECQKAKVRAAYAQGRTPQKQPPPSSPPCLDHVPLPGQNRRRLTAAGLRSLEKARSLCRSSVAQATAALGADDPLTLRLRDLDALIVAAQTNLTCASALPAKGQTA